MQRTTSTLKITNIDVGLLAGLTLITTLVFWSGLNAGFVSDAFFFVDFGRTVRPEGLLQRFVPSGQTFYRPITDLAIWVLYRFFGPEPFGYHAFALLCHIVSAVIIYFIVLKLCANRVAAFVGALVFAVGIHAHEVVWDFADIHNALSGVTLLGSIAAYIYGRHIVSLALLAVTLLIDETGLLIVPIVILYEWLLPGMPVASKQSVFQQVSRIGIRLLPFAGVIALSLLPRIILSPRGLYNEADPCHSPQCLASGLMEYINRLFVRTEGALSIIWDRRPHVAALTTVVVIALVLALRPWTWRNYRAIIFALGWLASSVAFFILTLWGYISDRFLYVPDMALAVLLGLLFAEGLRIMETATLPWRVTAVLGG